MAFVIASGGIDLSIGSVLAYSSIIWLCHEGEIPVPLAVALGILAGVIIGLCSGLLISRLRLNPWSPHLALCPLPGFGINSYKIISDFWFPQCF